MKKFITKVCLFIILFSYINTEVFYLAEETSIAELDKEIAELEKQNQEAVAQEAQAKEQLDNYEDLILQIHSQMETLEAEINQKNTEIESMNSQIAETQAQIDYLNAEIPKQKANADDTIILLQELEHSNVLIDVLMSSEENVLRHIQSMSVLLSAMADPLKELIETQKELEQTEADLEIQLKNLEVESLELDSKNIELQQQESDLEYYIEQQQQIIANAQETYDYAQDEIETKQDLVDFYASQGCSGDDVYGVDCGVTPPSTSDESGVIRPITNGYVTCEYGGYANHRGIDLGTKSDNTIYPIYPGQVVSAEYHSEWGNNVLLIHSTPNGVIFTRYAHLSSISVSPGQTVDYNTVLGQMGATGVATGKHLHLEITPDSNGDGYPGSTERINPRTYVDFPGLLDTFTDRTTYYGTGATYSCI